MFDFTEPDTKKNDYELFILYNAQEKILMNIIFLKKIWEKQIYKRTCTSQ